MTMKIAEKIGTLTDAITHGKVEYYWSKDESIGEKCKKRVHFLYKKCLKIIWKGFGSVFFDLVLFTYVFCVSGNHLLTAYTTYWAL